MTIYRIYVSCEWLTFRSIYATIMSIFIRSSITCIPLAATFLRKNQIAAAAESTAVMVVAFLSPAIQTGPGEVQGGKITLLHCIAVRRRRGVGDELLPIKKTMFLSTGWLFKQIYWQAVADCLGDHKKYNCPYRVTCGAYR